MKREETLILFAVTVADTLMLAGSRAHCRVHLHKFDATYATLWGKQVCFFFQVPPRCSVRAFKTKKNMIV